MKKFFYLCLLLACVGCVSNTDKGSEDASKEITKTFEDFGFSIAAPCDFKALPPVEDGDTTNYVFEGIEGNYPNNATQFLIVVKKTPRVFEELSEAEQNEQMDKIKTSDFPEVPGYPASYTNVEKVSFSDHNYPGYVGDNGYVGMYSRTVEFNKGRYIISLTVMADSSKQEAVRQKYDRFTSSFKVIE